MGQGVRQWRIQARHDCECHIFEAARAIPLASLASPLVQSLLTCVSQYTYLLSVPLICTYACGFAFIKVRLCARGNESRVLTTSPAQYTEGWVDLPGIGILPKPHEMWSQGHQDLIFPLQMLFAVAWGLEMCVLKCLRRSAEY